MAIALGAFDPKTPPDEAYEMLCLAFPDLPERVRRAERQYVDNSGFVAFIDEMPA